jgi:PrtD family type I secretion system ABC transporter
MKNFLKKWTKYFAFAGLFSCFINLLYLTFPVYMLAIYDKVLTSYSMPTLITITVGALFALLVFGLLDFLRSRLLVKAGVAMDNAMSRQVFSEMLKDACRLQKQGYSQGLRDVNTLRNYFAGNAVFFIFDAPWTPIFLLIIYILHPMLGLVATAGAVIIIVLGILQDIMTRKRIDAANAVSSKGQNLLSAGMRNSDVMGSMGMLPGLVEHWKRKNDEVIRLQTEASRHAGLFQSSTKSFRLSMQVIIFGAGAYLVLHGQATAGIIIAASITMGRALAPIEQGMSTWKQTVEARAAYSRLDLLIKNVDNREKLPLPSPKGKLDVEGVNLNIGGRFILRGISFSLQAGELMGLIGPSAAGKSSLCRIILGLWPAMGGKVRLDGADVFEWDNETLGPYIGYLPQDVELFPGTVSDNIARMGDPDPEKIVAAATMAGVHEIVLGLPGGYDTPLGYGGVNLSGGQRQRIGLARALYGDPKLVILDEPNSNLDEAGEAALVHALALLKEREVTTIVVTHKPSILSGVNKVLYLSDGQMVIFGPMEEVFKQLMARQKSQKSFSNVTSLGRNLS